MEEEPLLAEQDQGGHQGHLVGEGIVVVVGVKQKEVEEQLSLDLKI